LSIFAAILRGILKFIPDKYFLWMQIGYRNMLANKFIKLPTSLKLNNDNIYPKRKSDLT
jgi:hypothetical protein